MKFLKTILILFFVLQFYQANSETLKYEQGVYEGETFFGNPHGRGKFELDDGAVYEGQFVHGSIEGRGSMTFSDGSKYTGEFKNNEFNGKGTMVFADGEKYFGEYKDGEPSGEGKIYYTSGATFVGIFKDGVRVKGKLTSEDGIILEGSFVNDKAEGIFKATYNDGVVEDILFKNGEIVEN